jgi:hypothetical protein
MIKGQILNADNRRLHARLPSVGQADGRRYLRKSAFDSRKSALKILGF